VLNIYRPLRMRILYYYILIILLPVFFASCKHSDTHDDHIHHGNEDWYAEYKLFPYAKVSDSCMFGYLDDSLKIMLYDFDLVGFNSQLISRSFDKDAKLDSITLEDVPGYPYHLYRFYDSISRFDLLVKSFGSEDYFYIDRAQLFSNLVRFKNGVNIGMTKDGFSDAMKYDFEICDTFRIYDGELSTDYDFIFVNDTLDKILIWAAN
jgi:hypothetical protein